VDERAQGRTRRATITLAMMFAACVGVVGASETAIGLLAIPFHAKGPLFQFPGQRGGLRRRHPGDPDPSQCHAYPVCAYGRVSVVDMYAGAFIPGILLGIFYIVYVIIRTMITPAMGPSLPRKMGLKFFSRDSLGAGR